MLISQTSDFIYQILGKKIEQLQQDWRLFSAVSCQQKDVLIGPWQPECGRPDS